MSKKLEQTAAEIRREYQRQWRQKNRDKVRRYNEAYWRRLAERKLAEEDGNNGK